MTLGTQLGADDTFSAAGALSPFVQQHPDAHLARQFGALASETRLELLRVLRTPRTLSEIGVPSRDRESSRVIARQVVRKHIDVLLETGMALAQETDREGRASTQFVLNHQAFFALSEDLRALGRLRPAVDLDEPTTPVAASDATATFPRGSLVLVKGLDEGYAYDIDATRSGRTEWTIGRRRDCDVALDFDPFLSSVNTKIAWRDGAHHIIALPESRNGTRVNFRPLASGSSLRLRHGDLIGVGRCVLTYWNA